MAKDKGAQPDPADEAVSLARSKGGRPRKLEPDEATLRMLTGLGVIQCTTKEGAAALSVSEPTFLKFLADYPEAKEAFEAGKGQGKVSLRRKQFKLAEKNAAMAIFLGKNYLEQTDRQEHSGPNGGAIPIDLQRLTREERRARIAELEAKRNGEAPDGADRG